MPSLLQLSKANIRKRLTKTEFSPTQLFANGEQGVWYDPSDLTPEKVSWRRNLLTYSQDFENAAWTKASGGTGSAGVVTANAGTDPLGGNTADRLQVTLNGGTASADISRIYQSNSTVATLTFSIYARSFDGTSTYAMVMTDAGGTRPITVTPTWQRFEFSATAAGSIFYGIGLRGGQTPTNSNTADILIWGAQLETGSTAAAYQRITDFSSDFLAVFPTHTLYQESTGVTPVTALGQSVGLVLDKSQGALSNLKSELVDTANDATTWVTNGNSITQDGTSVRIEYVSSSNSYVNLSAVGGTTVNLTVGKSYLVSWEMRVDGGSNVGFRVYNGAINWYEQGGGVTSTSFTRYKTVLTCAGIATGVYVMVRDLSTGDVAYVRNISVREVAGNHAIQSTIGSRPTLQARTNLVIGSETLSTFTVLSSPSISANSTVAPDGTITADRFEVSAGQTGFDIRNVGPDSSAGNNAYSVYFKRDANATGTLAIGRPDRRTTTVNIATLVVTNQTIVSEIPTMGRVVDVGNGWYRLECGVTLSTSTEIRITVRDTVPGSAIWLWGAQSELGTSPTTYQRVTTTTNYADVGAPRGLQFDGVDDWMWTSSSVDFSTTDKMTVFSGLTKLNDTATGIISELSINVGSNNGTFVLAAPSTNGANSYRYTSRGTAESFAGSGVFALAPDTTVLTSVSDIGTDIVQLRRNTVVVETSNTDQGTGNYGSYPLYIGRRGGTTFPFNGRLHQLLIRGAATDDFTITNTERWVARRTGVNL